MLKMVIFGYEPTYQGTSLKSGKDGTFLRAPNSFQVEMILFRLAQFFLSQSDSFQLIARAKQVLFSQQHRS
jgi:hypothetical protein